MTQLKVIAIVLAFLVVVGNIVLTIQNSRADTTPPELKIEEDTLELSVKAEKSAYLQGVTASDAQDGDLTDQVILEHVSQLTGEDTVLATYGVFDAAGNVATATRTIRFTDYSGPVFSVSQPLHYTVSSVVTLLDRISATDPFDGDISNQIRATNVSLNNDTEGVYRIEVQVTNSLGDTSILDLPVVIADDTALTPEIELSTYLVYLQVGDEFKPRSYITEVSDPARDPDSPVYKSSVRVDSDVNTEKPGTYDVTYTLYGAKDDYQVMMTVVVTEPEEDAQ